MNYVEVAHAEEEPREVRLEVIYNWDKDRIEEEIRYASEKYNVSFEQMYATIRCESGFDIDIQSNHTLSYGREESYGLVQIHLPDWPHISRKDATNPRFAIDFMAKHFSKGNQHYWTCWRNIYT